MKYVVFAISLIAFYLYLITEHGPFGLVAVINVLIFIHNDIIREIKKAKEVAE